MAPYEPPRVTLVGSLRNLAPKRAHGLELLALGAVAGGAIAPRVAAAYPPAARADLLEDDPPEDLDAGELDAKDAAIAPVADAWRPRRPPTPAAR